MARTVQSVCQPGPIGRTSVGVVAARQSMATTVVFGELGTTILPRGSEQICAGCFSKVFTATLVAGAACDGRLQLDDLVTQRLGVLAPQVLELLGGITIRHLLHHTHGLDGSHLSRAPSTIDGRVDMERLGYALCGARRLSRAGDLYNYGSVGAWIAAAILEALYGASYFEILVGRLFDPLGMEYHAAGECPSHGSSPVSCCPATGGRVTVSLEGMLKFLSYHVVGDNGGGRSTAAALMRQQIIRLPGWAAEIGACLGWKYFGAGWYGHGSDTDGCSGVIRVNPDQGLGMITAARSRASFLLNARLFREVLPDTQNVTRGVMRDAAPPEAVESERYVGTYGNRVLTLSIVERAKSLVLEARSTNGRPSAAQLNSLGDNMFSLGARRASGLSLIQFIQPSGGRFGCLWNGRAIFPRVEV